MPKNKLKKLIVCCVILGIAIAGGILYFTKHRNSKKSLEKDFHDFKDAFDEAKEQKALETGQSPLSILYIYAARAGLLGH